MVKVNIVGLDQFQSKLKSIPEQLKREVRGVVEAGAKTFVRNAKKQAPKDMGFLTGGISFTKISDLTFEVVSSKEYSPYIEWGTITKVKVPSELQSYAIQFKGKGIRKNGGIIPRPFFFPQAPLVKRQIENGIAAVLNKPRTI